ncbi:hypothetical protein [Lacrimispora algidixylanolytica]|uniref:Uncharacterized protein n=1 Tax=Lacrimispora algidixylanolytica TaxID=94868 RepID=A0A419SY98_9FIRM|nr:hypothetical protein [Lacrimispora algidixylanolytica]RKD30227.1 hypothetical protein BET01_06430 [Lacrimispora algidixylanolytica]
MRRCMPYPPKTFIPYNDFYISCILAGGENYHFVLAENFIRCYADEEDNSNWIDYFESQKYEYFDVFKGFELSSDCLKGDSSLISDKIKHYLDMGYTIIYNVDTFYITSYATYNYFHSFHSLMIYDYDDQYNFKGRDYFNFTNYSEKLVPMSDINTSYQEVYGENKNYNNWLMIGVKLDDDLTCTTVNNLKPFYNPRKPDLEQLKESGLKLHCDILSNPVCNIQLPYDSSKPKVNLEKILFYLNEFVDGVDYVKNDIRYTLYSECKYKTGIHIFDAMEDKLLYIFTEALDQLNMRTIKFIEHHIFMMKLRIEILKFEYDVEISDELVERINQLSKQSERFTLSIIKISIKREEADMLKAIALLNKLKIEYKSIIRVLIHSIEREITKGKRNSMSTSDKI